MTERNTSQKRQRKAKPEFSIREELLKVIAAAKKEPAITSSHAQSRCLNKLIEFVQTDDIFVDTVGSYSMVGQFPPYLYELDDCELRGPVGYNELVDYQGLEVGTDELSAYLEISAERIKVSIRDAKKLRNDVFRKLPAPFPVNDCAEVLITKIGSKGKGNTHLFRRCIGPVYRFLNTFLDVKPAISCPSLMENYADLSIREILCKARGKSNAPLDLHDWMLPLMNEYDVFATEKYGLIIADKGDGFQKILKDIGWANRDHVDLLMTLRGNERMPWGTFQSQGLGECTGLPWSALVFDLPNIKSAPSFEHSDVS